MTQSTICSSTELRKLRPAELCTLGQILNVSDSWKKLMAIIPKEGTADIPKFNSEHFSMIEQAVHQQRRNAAEIFLEEWGTMGKDRPTLRTLLNFLTKAELFRAADYVAGNLLKEEIPDRPKCGPAAAVDISDETIRKLLEEKALLQDADSGDSLILGSSAELSIDKIVYLPEGTADKAENSSLRRNMQSTKLASDREKFHEKCVDVLNNVFQEVHKRSVAKEVSDLMKFSTEEDCSIKKENTVGKGNHEDILPPECESVVLPACILEKQEIPSQELPAFLNEFGQNRDLEEARINQELNSDDLPLCLNSNRLPSGTTSNNENFNSTTSTNDSSGICNLNISQNEMISTELPQCVAELGSNTSKSSIQNVNINRANKHNSLQNALASQELPITVLEYDRG